MRRATFFTDRVDPVAVKGRLMQTILLDKDGLQWIDFLNPNKKELEAAALRFSLPKAVVRDAMDPTHLPKIETFDRADFILLRHFDLKALTDPEADTITELTRKIAIFATGNVLITIHRTQQPFLEKLKLKWTTMDPPPTSLADLKMEIIREVVLTYDLPLRTADDNFGHLENKVFSTKVEPGLIEDLYFLKLQVGVYRRMLRQNMDIIFTLQSASKERASQIQDLREEVQRVYQHADQLVEDINHLFGTHISLASHRTNETMRLLTVFSVFFLPLTFLVGVYGMNFKYMPELESRWGYPGIWAVMLGTSAAIFAWVRKKGWLVSTNTPPKKPS
jgi:magnesium transporter